MKSDTIRKAFWEAYRRGVPLKEIAKNLGLSTRCLRYWADEMNLPARPRPGRWMPPKAAK